MKKDITTRADIEQLVQRFYEKVRADPMIGPLFGGMYPVNWERHLPIMYDFWENTLFYTGTYTGNPIQTHRKLHERYPLNSDHFRQWVHLFTETVDELFEGEKALLARQRALSIATVMKVKLLS